MATELSYDAIEVGKKYGPWEYPLAERFPHYLEAVENAHDWHSGRSPWGPSVAPPSFLGPAGIWFLSQVGSLPAGAAPVQVEIETAAALRLDRRPHAYGEFTDKFEKDGRKCFKFLTRWRDETGIIVGHSTLTVGLAEEGLPAASGDRKGDLTPVTHTPTPERLAAYAESAAPAATALIAADYICELMMGVFGKDWFENAGLSVSFGKPVGPGDTITANGRLSEQVLEGAVERKVYEVWAENQAGDAVAAGHAYSLVIPGS